MKGESNQNRWNRTGAAALAIAAALLIAGPAQAAPIVGVFESHELGGYIFDGRWSESFPDAGQWGEPNSTINAASWDGIELGSQWVMSGQYIEEADDHQLLTDEKVGALRIRKYLTEYTGGELHLKKIVSADPDERMWWNQADGGDEYVINIDYYSQSTQITTIPILDDQEVGCYSLITLTGTFADHPDYQLRFMLAVAVKLDEGPGPDANYPDYLVPDGYDGVPMNMGQWGIAQKIRMEITPEPATVGLLALGGLVILARRRSRRNARA